MAQQQHRKFGWIAKLWIIMNLTLMMTPIANAQNIDLKCPNLNEGEKTTKYVISIIEEQFGEKLVDENDKTDSKILFCARKTTCEDDKEKKRKCTSTFVDRTGCTPSNADNKIVTCQTVQVFIAQSGINLLFAYIGLIYKWAASVIGIVSVFYLIYGGIKIATAGDDQSKLDEAKTKIGQSIAGLVLLFMSAIILYTINPNFFTL